MEKEKILIIIRNASILVTGFFLVLSVQNILSKKKVVYKIVSDERIQRAIDSTEKLEKNTKDSATTTKKAVPEKPKLVPCYAGNTDFDCYFNFYTNLVKQKGVPEAFKVLKEEFPKNPYVVAQCHPLTHVIGHAALSLYPNVSDAFNHGDPYCWSGYYHGVMEEISERIGVGGIEKQLNNICSAVEGKETYSFNYYNCVHGLGHGVMAVNEDNLFISLKMCDALSGEWEKQSCYGGVFMENVIIDNKGDHTDYLKPEDPMYPCNAVDIHYKSSCYLMQTSYALKATNNDFLKVFDLCKNADNGFQDTCYQSLGRDASGQSSSNAEITKKRCDLGSDYEQKSNCVVGAVKDFVAYYHSDVQAKAFCSMLSPELSQICTDTAVAYYKSF